MPDNRIVYWESPEGKIEIDPAQDGRPRLVYKCWNLKEAIGLHEVEELSKRLSRQRHEEHQKLKTKNMLRRIEETRQKACAIRLGIHQAISPADAELKRRTALAYDGMRDKMLEMVYAEFDVSKRTSGLEMELTDAKG